MLWVAIATLARAGERDPLPALAVERPLGTPRGWLQVRVDEREDPGGAFGTLELRYGILPRIEVAVAADARWSPFRVPTSLQLRTTLLRTEPPNRSVVLDLQLQPPATLRDAPLAATIALAAAQQLGPFLVSARAGHTWPDAWPVDAQLLLQAGPLAPFGSLHWTDAPMVGGGLELQLSRGLELHGELGRSLTSADQTSRIGVGMAF